MFKEAFEDALVRGDKLRKELTKEILNSQVFADLANNPRFVNAVAKVIRSKTEVARSVQNRVKEVLGKMNVPTRKQFKEYERRVARLEKELDTASRKLFKRLSAVVTGVRSSSKAPKKRATTAVRKKKAVVKKAVKKKAVKKKVRKAPARKTTKAKRATTKAKPKAKAGKAKSTRAKATTKKRTTKRRTTKAKRR